MQRDAKENYAVNRKHIKRKYNQYGIMEILEF